MFSLIREPNTFNGFQFGTFILLNQAYYFWSSDGNYWKILTYDFQICTYVIILIDTQVSSCRAFQTYNLLSCFSFPFLTMLFKPFFFKKWFTTLLYCESSIIYFVISNPIQETKKHFFSRSVIFFTIETPVSSN